MNIGHRFNTEYCDKEYREITRVYCACVEDIVWCIVAKKEVFIVDDHGDTIKGIFTGFEPSGFRFRTHDGASFIFDPIGEYIEWAEADI